MELTKIENLLEVYFEGNTTLDEERILQKYFSQAFVATHLQEYKTLFNYFSESRAVISEQPIRVKTKKQTRNRSWLSIAAAIVLLFTIYKITPTNTGFTDTEIAEAERAFVESQRAFNLISKSLHRGSGQVAYLENYEKTKNKIFKNK